LLLFGNVKYLLTGRLGDVRKQEVDITCLFNEV